MFLDQTASLSGDDQKATPPVPVAIRHKRSKGGTRLGLGHAVQIDPPIDISLAAL
jgi:hypothetical protein